MNLDRPSLEQTPESVHTGDTRESVAVPGQQPAASSTSRAGSASIGVAVAGFGWMGRVHTQAYCRVRHHYAELALAPRLEVVAEAVPGRAEEAAAQFGFRRTAVDWRALAGDPDVVAVSITAPNFLHREMGSTLAAAGKHIWIEKPVGPERG